MRGKTVDADHERCRKRDRRTRREGRRRTCGRPPRRLPAFETPVSVGRARFRGRRLLSSLRGECRQPRPGNARTRILNICFVSHPLLAVISRFNGPAESRPPWSRKPTECLGRGASLSSETRRAAPAVAEGRSHLSVVRALILGTRERRPFSPREDGRPARAAFTGDVTTLSARRCVSVRAELIYAFPCSPRGSS